MKRTSSLSIGGTAYNSATALAFTLYGSSESYKLCAQHLYQLPEERDTDALDAVKSKFGLT